MGSASCIWMGQNSLLDSHYKLCKLKKVFWNGVPKCHQPSAHLTLWSLTKFPLRTTFQRLSGERGTHYGDAMLMDGPLRNTDWVINNKEISLSCSERPGDALLGASRLNSWNGAADTCNSKSSGNPRKWPMPAHPAGTATAKTDWHSLAFLSCGERVSWPQW